MGAAVIVYPECGLAPTLSHFDASNNRTKLEIMDLILEMERLILGEAKCLSLGVEWEIETQDCRVPQPLWLSSQLYLNQMQSFYFRQIPRVGFLVLWLCLLLFSSPWKLRVKK